LLAKRSNLPHRPGEAYRAFPEAREDALERPRPDLQPRPGGTHALLVASGEAAVRRLLCDTFLDDRYQVHEEESEEGVVAMAMISRPALVILDSDLRGGEGITACRRLKAHRLTRGCYVVVISGHAEPEERAQALGAGADDFLVKPFSPLRLIEIANRLAGAARARPGRATQGGGGGAAPAGGAFAV
jgi:DNA-binding response OmpR family regulator